MAGIASAAKSNKMAMTASSAIAGKRTVKIKAGSACRCVAALSLKQQRRAMKQNMVSSVTFQLDKKGSLPKRNMANKHLSKSAVVRAGPEFNIDTEEIVGTLKEKWDGVEDKSQALLYAGGALLGLYVVNAIVGAVNSLPVIPKLMELVGLGYTVWFTYRYLIFKSNRVELKKEIEELKSKISGIGSD